MMIPSRANRGRQGALTVQTVRNTLHAANGWRCELWKGTDQSCTAIATSYIPKGSHRPQPTPILCFPHVQWRLKLLPFTEPQNACRNLQHPCRRPQMPQMPQMPPTIPKLKPADQAQCNSGTPTRIPVHGLVVMIINIYQVVCMTSTHFV